MEHLRLSLQVAFFAGGMFTSIGILEQFVIGMITRKVDSNWDLTKLAFLSSISWALVYVLH
jgi:hypothetical protein